MENDGLSVYSKKLPKVVHASAKSKLSPLLTLTDTNDTFIEPTSHESGDQQKQNLPALHTDTVEPILCDFANMGHTLRFC